jgi:thiamine transport system permease protein
VAVVMLAVVVPLAAVLWRAVHIDGRFTTEALTRVLGEPRTWRVLGVTFAQAVGSAVAAVAAGLPVAVVLHRFAFPGRGVVRSLAMVPFVLPSVVIGAAFAALLGPRGLAGLVGIDLRGSWWAVVTAHVCCNLAVVVRVVGASLDRMGPELEEAARLAGAGPAEVLRRVTLPLIAPAVWSSAIVVLLFCLTSFGVIVVLGGGPVTTIEVEMWTRATRQFDLPGAAVLAGLQAAMVVGVLAVVGPAGRASAARGRRPRARAARTPAQRSAVAAAVAIVLVVSAAPLAALAWRSVSVGGHLGLDHWRALGRGSAAPGMSVDPLAAVLASLRAAVPAALVAVALGVPAAMAVARRPNGLAARVLLLPLAVSATTVGLGLLLVAGRPPLDLRRSPWLVAAAQALVALPLVVRAVAPAARALPPSPLEAARVAGAGPWRTTLAVRLPLLRPAVTAAAGLAGLAALGEFGATVFVARPASPTMPVAISRLLARPGESGPGQAMALACVLVALCGLLLWLLDRGGAGRGVGLEG